MVPDVIVQNPPMVTGMGVFSANFITAPSIKSVASISVPVTVSVVTTFAGGSGPSNCAELSGPTPMNLTITDCPAPVTVYFCPGTSPSQNCALTGSLGFNNPPDAVPATDSSVGSFGAAKSTPNDSGTVNISSTTPVCCSMNPNCWRCASGPKIHVCT